MYGMKLIFFSSRRRHTRWPRDWSSDVCSSDLDTLLNLVGGLDRPTAGSIQVDGKNIVRLSENDLVAYRRDRVGFVFQFFNLVPVLTAWENVELPMRFADVPAKERETRARGLLEMVGLKDKGDRKPDQM